MSHTDIAIAVFRLLFFCRTFKITVLVESIQILNSYVVLLSYLSQGYGSLSDNISTLSSRFQHSFVPNIHVSSINSSIFGNTVYKDKDVEIYNRTISVWSASVLSFCYVCSCSPWYTSWLSFCDTIKTFSPLVFWEEYWLSFRHLVLSFSWEWVRPFEQLAA